LVATQIEEVEPLSIVYVDKFSRAIEGGSIVALRRHDSETPTGVVVASLHDSCLFFIEEIERVTVLFAL